MPLRHTSLREPPPLALDIIPWQRALLMIGGASLIAAHGMHVPWAQATSGAVAVGVLSFLSLAALVRLYAIREHSKLPRLRPEDAPLPLWPVGMMLAVGFAYAKVAGEASPWTWIAAWSQVLLAVRVITELAPVPRRISTAGFNPAFVFVGSFVALILTGALLLMLPVCRVQAMPEAEVGTPWLVALFTSTSASCVTGLAVVDTSTHWSRTGLVVMMLLIQFGGLGVMTFGAFFALGSQRGFFVKEGVFMGSLLEKDDRAEIRRLMWSILLFTFAAELTGAVLMMGLVPSDSLGDRMFGGLFHSVSAFCNAGFATFPKNLEGLELRFEVWGVIAWLIIIGGLGFDVLRNTAAVVRAKFLPGAVKSTRRRLTLTSLIVLVTTAGLLLVGTAAFAFFESSDTLANLPWQQRLAHAWFQSVTCRTAGFNTLDFGKMHPASKLFAVVLMFIGASPGSTGGGVKTVAFALTVLAAVSVIRRRETVELRGRSIPETLVKRAALVVAVALALVLTATLLMVVVENKPLLFLDHLFEVTSAFGTVGLSTGITASLKPASQYILIALMFIGRIGPITLLLSLTPTTRAPKYEYPTERVALG